MTRWSKALASRDDDARIDASWQHVRARRARPRVVKRARVAIPMVALLAVLFLVVRQWLVPVPAPASVALPAAGKATPPSAVAAVPGASIALASGDALPARWATVAAEVVPLDDGSRLELAPQTVVRRGDGAADRVALAVESGRATFDVKPDGLRTWVIDAGAVQVRVLGTRFTVSRANDVVEVSVERGKVQVTSPTGTSVLLAGDSFTSAAPAAPPSASLAPSASPASVAAVNGGISAPAPAPVPSPSTAPPALPSGDPLTTADALRRAGSPREAVSVLRSVVDAHDGRSPLAAFTIAKIHAEDLRDPAEAARSFEQAIILGLPAGLDEEAQARAVESFARAGQRAEVARAAKRYESRYPAGRHLTQVREWARD